MFVAYGNKYNLCILYGARVYLIINHVSVDVYLSLVRSIISQGQLKSFNLYKIDNFSKC